MTTDEKKRFNKSISYLKSKIENDIIQLFSEHISISNDEAILDSENSILDLNEKILKSVKSTFAGHDIDPYIHYKLIDVEELIQSTYEYGPKKITGSRYNNLGKYHDALRNICDSNLQLLLSDLNTIAYPEQNIGQKSSDTSKSHLSGDVKSILNMHDVSELTGLAISTLYKKTAANELKFTKPGGKIMYFKREDVEDWIMKNQNMSQDEIEQAVINSTMRRKND